MPARSRDELLAVCEKEYAKLETLLDKVPEPLRLETDDDDTSLKDIVGHRAHWIELFLGWYRDGLAGRDVQFPAPGYKWNELKRYNADLRTAQKDLGWEEVRDMLAVNHRKLMGLITETGDEALYSGPMKGARNDWAAGRWAEAAGPSHYRSAAKYIRQRLRAFGKT